MSLWTFAGINCARPALAPLSPVSRLSLPVTKTITPALRTHLDEDVPRLATIGRIIRVDGKQLDSPTTTGTSYLGPIPMRVRIEMDGIFGFTGRICYWPAFSAYAVNRDRPFLSKTGYRTPGAWL